MRKLILPLSTVLMASIIFITLGFKILKKEEVVKENNEAKELIDKMEASFDLLPFELSLEEKMRIVNNPKQVVHFLEDYNFKNNESSDLACSTPTSARL